MSTQTDNFSNDYTQLIDDANYFGSLQNDQATDVTNYHNQWLALGNISNPEQLFMMLIYLISEQGFDQMDGTLAMEGGALQVQGDITKCDNDIQALTNSNSTDSTLIENEASHLDQMLDALNNNTNIQIALGGTQQAPDGPTSAASDLYTQDLAMRREIYWDNDTEGNTAATGGGTYNPTPVGNPVAGGSRTYFFDPDNGSNPNDPTIANPYLSSYAQMQAQMQVQGDPYGSTTAAKNITDASNMNTNTTQSTNQASNVVITNEKNIISTIQSFVVDMMHAQADVIKATINAPK